MCQYSQKFLCGTIGGRGGKNICKERKSSQMVLPTVCLDKKKLKASEMGRQGCLKTQ